MKPLKQSFFMNETTKVAEKLLGCYLLRKLKSDQWLIGKIIETEAYLGSNDSCCHSFNNLYTQRNQSMYLPGGYSYVYFTYGMYYCFNIVTKTSKEPEAVLIRALEPIEGIKEMKKNRKKEKLTDLCSGPGKLCQALNITISLNAKKLDPKEKIYIAQGASSEEIETDSRIGLPQHKDSAHWLLRFYFKDNPFISVKQQI